MKNRYQFRKAFAQHGIDLVYNDRSRSNYLRILGAPTFAEGDGVELGQLTGWFRIDGGLKALSDVPATAQRIKDLYRERWADNPQMMLYLDRCDYHNLFIFDDELCVGDTNPSCVDGYLWATEGLVARLKALVAAERSPEELASINDPSFYAVYDYENGKISLLGTYWYTEDNSQSLTDNKGSVELPLNEKEARGLVAALELYCRLSYSKTCLELLNEVRAVDGIPALAVTSPSNTVAKPSLADAIKAADARTVAAASISARSQDLTAR